MIYRKISEFLAVLVLIINSYLSGRHLGFDEGYHQAVKYNSEISLSGGGITDYTILFEHYQPIVIFLVIYLIGQSIKEFLSQIISFLTLSWVIYLYWRIYTIKTSLFTPEISFNESIIKTMPLDFLWSL